MIRVVRNPAGPRVYVLGLRVHHGAVGVALIVSYPLSRRWRRGLALAGGAAGVLLLAHNREYRDFPFTDNRNH